MKGRARAYGAVTIVNALATGKGAALSIELSTEAEVELVPGGAIEARIEEEPNEDTTLARRVCQRLLRRLGLEGYGARIITRSEIPIAKGLKSSSAAANAIALAILKATGKELEDEELLKECTLAATEAGVSITGAYDDASASLLGGVTVTDNLKRLLLRHYTLEEGLWAVLLIPERKVYTAQARLEHLKRLAFLFEEAHAWALEGEWWRAKVLNGLACCSSWSLDPRPILEALSHGALAAGVSGTGPALTAICRSDAKKEVEGCWKGYEGEVRACRVNNESSRGD